MKTVRYTLLIHADIWDKLCWLTHWPLGDVAIILELSFWNSLCRIVDWALTMKLLTSKCYRTLLMKCHHWFRWWLGAVRQQAINWTNIDHDLCHHMASQGFNELTDHMTFFVHGYLLCYLQLLYQYYNYVTYCVWTFENSFKVGIWYNRP